MFASLKTNLNTDMKESFATDRDIQKHHYKFFVRRTNDAFYYSESLRKVKV